MHENIFVRFVVVQTKNELKAIAVKLGYKEQIFCPK